MSKMLFDASDESDNELQLGTNQDYAKSYNSFRKKELLKKYKDRGIDVSESDFSNDSETSSEEEQVEDVKFDQEFFKTLASLKSKDPAIYDKGTRFFEGVTAKHEENDNEDTKAQPTTSSKQKKTKPVTLKDYERKIILEKGGKFEDDSDSENEQHQQRSASPTVIEEERRLKAEFRKVMNADDSEEEGFGGIFKKREKTKQQEDDEEADFVKWLAGKQQEIDETAKEKLQPLKNYWGSNKLPQSEKFLRDYILNKGYADTNVADIPTYDEIVGDNAPLSEDEEELEKQAEFEHKYNFRFEEPDAEFIKRYPRTIESSVRRTDEKRKQKRHELKQRKQQEKEQKMKELEMVKDMKRREIAEKIEKLKMVTGNDELGFKDEELEDDFDPEAHDRRMQEIFNEEYYQVDEGEEKPECPSDIDELKIEDWDNYNPERAGEYGGEDYEPHCEDEDFNMDCDYDAADAKEQLQKELIESTKGRKSRKGRKRNRFMEMIQADKPAFNPEDEKTYADYIDEYYKMDCEDIIGDTPCRFKYVETMPNDFGLTIEEILLAKNKELNQWASLKKAIQIRPDHLEKKEQRLYKLKAKNEQLKRKIFKSLYGSDNEEEDDATDELVTTANSEQTGKDADLEAVTGGSKKAKKKRKRKAQAGTVLNGVAEEVQAGNAEEAPEEVSAKKLKLQENGDEKKATPNKIEIRDQSAANKKKKGKNKNAEMGEKNQKGKQQNPERQQQQQHRKPQNQQKFANQQKTKPESKTLQNPPLKGAQNAFSQIKKNNPFNKTSDRPEGLDPLPPLRKNQSRAKGGKPVAGKFKQNKFTHKRSAGGNDATNISDERLKAYGINPKRFHKKQKYGKKQSNT